MDWLLGIFLICLGAIMTVGLMGLFFERWSALWLRPATQHLGADPVPEPPDVFLNEGKTAYADQSCAHHRDHLGQDTCHDCRRLFCQDCLYTVANPHVSDRKESRCKRCHNEWCAMLDAEANQNNHHPRPQGKVRRAPLQIVSGTADSSKVNVRAWGRADELRRRTGPQNRTFETHSRLFPQEDDHPDWISEAPTRLLNPN